MALTILSIGQERARKWWPLLVTPSSTGPHWRAPYFDAVPQSAGTSGEVRLGRPRRGAAGIWQEKCLSYGVSSKPPRAFGAKEVAMERRQIRSKGKYLPGELGILRTKDVLDLHDRFIGRLDGRARERFLQAAWARGW